MFYFAQKSKAQQNTSAKSSIPGRVDFRQSREVSLTLHVQHTIANPAVQRLSQTRSEDLENVSDPTAMSFEHDFSSIPLSPQTRMEDMHQIAQHGIQGNTGRLPYVDQIQQAFGPKHQLRQVKAHIGSQAAAAARHLGAEAYTIGESVAFGAAPNLRTAAHEAAHVVQQRSGVQLMGGLSQAGDRYEQNAEAVADRVARGESAQELLERFPPTRASSSSNPIQRQPGRKGQVEVPDEGVLERAEKNRGEHQENTQRGEKVSAAARQDFESLPGPLKEILKLSFRWPDRFWAELEPRQKTSLAEAYNRLSALGLWKHVAKVRGEHEKPEARAFGGLFEVAGRAGSIGFEAHDATAFVMGLVRSGKFGFDPWWAKLLHPGQDSLREFNTVGGSLHISVGPGNKFDTHVDQVGAVNKPEDNQARFDPFRSLKHHTREVWPEKIRQYFLLPGVIFGFGPELADLTKEPGPYDDKFLPAPSKGKEEILGSVNIVLHPVSKPKPRLVPHPGPEAGTAYVDAQVMDRAVAAGAAAATVVDLMPNPVGAHPDEFADPAAIANSLAGRITNAARTGQTIAVIDLGLSYLKASPQEQKSIGEAVGRIGAAVAAQLPPETQAVKILHVLFGSPKRGVYVSLRP